MTLRPFSAITVRPARHGPILAGLAGAVLFFMRFGSSYLRPTNIQWLLAGFDQAMYFLGWDFYRHSPWLWPPGLITGYCAPQGSAIGLVDGLPILALPFKLISPLLPQSFQYFGMWTLASYVLQGVVAYAILGAVTSRIAHRLLGAGFFLLMPSFLQRQGHLALATHWLLLGALYLYLRRPSPSCRSQVLPWIGLATLAAGVHVYLTIMVLAVGTAALLRARVPDRTCSWRGLATGLAGMALGVGAAWLLAGNFSIPGSLAVERNYGIYSANLNTLINPTELGRLLPKLPTWGTGQYEGFNYLGAGVLLLALVALAMGWSIRSWSRRLRRHGWLALILVGMAVFAVSDHVAWGNHLLLQVTLPEWLQRVADTFRASGRFLWPPAYFLLYLILRAIIRHLPARLSLSLLAVALVVQVADLAPVLNTHQAFSWMRYEPRLVHPGWQQVVAGAAAIRVVPSCAVSHSQEADFKEFAWLADRARIPVTAGYTARVDVGAARRFDDRLRADADAGHLAGSCLYVVWRHELPQFWAGNPDSLMADIWDGYYVLYPRATWPEHQGTYASMRRVELGRYLSERGDHLVLLAVMDEATTGLSAVDRDAMRRMGSEIDRLGYRQAYVGVAAGGRMLLERFGADAALDLDLGPEIAWPGLSGTPPIHLRSAGFDQGNDARIVIGGQDLCFEARGFNTVAIDSLGRPVEVGSFDTFRGGPGLVAVLARPGTLAAAGAPAVGISP